jgi:drug/metabolite transporter (DMT)-like permease
MTSTTTGADPRSAVALFALGAAFGASFLFMKVLSDELSTFEIVAGRLLLGSAVLALIIAVRGKGFAMTRADLLQISGLALVEPLIPFSLVAWAESRIDAGTASLLISTMPVFTVVMAMTVFADERRAPLRLAAIPLGIAGVIVLTGGDVLRLSGGNSAGQLAVIGAACAYAGATVYSRVLLRTHDPINLTATKLAVAGVAAAALIVPTSGAPAYGSLSAEGLACLAALGIVSTALAFSLYMWLVSSAGSVYSSLVTYVAPVFGVVLGWAILGEHIGAETAVGAALIALAVAGAMYGPALWERLGRALREREPALVQAPGACKENYA